ncbi:MAG: cytochrome c biogenesis protein CcsA, partial [Candidatus Hodarchaeales archaeon]
MLGIDLGIFYIDIGMLLLLISLIAFLIDVLILFAGEQIDQWELFSEVSLAVGLISILISFFYFSMSVLNADYNFTYVFDYVNNDMDFILRVSAIWSGQEGSFFFWTVLTAVVYFIFRLLFRNYGHEPFFWRSFLLASLQVAILTALTLMSDPFQIDITPVADGYGLNPLLLTVWNVIHPPIIFVGYTFCMLPMVIAIARMTILEDGKVSEFEGKEKLDKFFDFLVSFAWLTLSSGIIIGGYWAYVTLGWGGFWAWDPVETASLIPWLFLTLFYHGKHFHKKNEYLGNYVISMSYFTALFATYLTRSNIVSSVHTFSGEKTLENLLMLFIPRNSFLMSAILRIIPDERMLVLFIVLVIIFLTPIILGIKTKEITRIPITLGRADLKKSRLQTTALKVSYISILFGTYIIILGLITPVIYDIIGYIITFDPRGFGKGVIIPVINMILPPAITVGPLFYNIVAAIFGGILLLAQFFCTFFPRFDFTKKIGLMVGGLIVGFFYAISGFFYRTGDLTTFLGEGNPIVAFFSSFWTFNDFVNFIIPFIIIGMIGLIIEFIRITLQEEKNFIRKTSQTMLHFSFLIIMLGALLSSNMTVSNNIFVQKGYPNTYENDLDGTSLRIEITKMTVRRPESGLHVLQYDTQFTMYSGSQPIGIGLSRLAYDKYNRMDHEVTILSTLFSDIYIVTSLVEP